MFDPQAVSLHLCLTWRCTWRMWAPIACQRHTPVVCNWTCDLAPLWGVFMVNGLCFQWPLIMVNTGNIVNGDIMEYSGFTYKYIYIHTHIYITKDFYGNIVVIWWDTSVYPISDTSLRGHMRSKKSMDRSDVGTAAQQGMVKPPTASNVGF